MTQEHRPRFKRIAALPAHPSQQQKHIGNHMEKQDILKLAEEADLWAEQQLECAGEYHPDYSAVRDVRFAKLAAAAVLERLVDEPPISGNNYAAASVLMAVQRLRR